MCFYLLWNYYNNLVKLNYNSPKVCHWWIGLEARGPGPYKDATERVQAHLMKPKNMRASRSWSVWIAVERSPTHFWPRICGLTRNVFFSTVTTYGESLMNFDMVMLNYESSDTTRLFAWTQCYSFCLWFHWKVCFSVNDLQ